MSRQPVVVNGYKSTTLATGQVGQKSTWATASRSATTATHPLYALVGTPPKNVPSVVIAGDSLDAGSNDSAGDGNGNYGPVQRGLWTAGAGGLPMPSLNVACPGEKVSQAVAGSHVGRFAVMRFASHVISNYGTNDILAANSFATVSANLTAFWAVARFYGVKIYQLKIIPRTTSTDGWATPANQGYQTGFAPGGVRDQVNTFITQSLAAGLIDGVVDLTPAVEDPANHGKWLTNGTADWLTNDGTHYTSSGAASVAPLVTAAAQAFTYVPPPILIQP